MAAGKSWNLRARSCMWSTKPRMHSTKAMAAYPGLPFAFFSDIPTGCFSHSPDSWRLDKTGSCPASQLQRAMGCQQRCSIQLCVAAFLSVASTSHGHLRQSADAGPHGTLAAESSLSHGWLEMLTASDRRLSRLAFVASDATKRLHLLCRTAACCRHQTSQNGPAASEPGSQWLSCFPTPSGRNTGQGQGDTCCNLAFFSQMLTPRQRVAGP